MGGHMNIGLLAAVLGVDASGLLPRRKKVEALSEDELAILRDKSQTKRDRRNAKRLRDHLTRLITEGVV